MTKKRKILFSLAKSSRILEFWVKAARYPLNQAFIQNGRGVWPTCKPIVK